MATKTAQSVSNATIKGLQSVKDQVFIITSDNGSEFAYHESMTQSLKANFYFAPPYAGWERGLNENTNGLVRQYIKKREWIASYTACAIMALLR